MEIGLCVSDLERMTDARGWGYEFVEIGARAVAPFEPDAAWPARRRSLADTGARITHLAGFLPAEVRIVGPDVDWGRARGYLETCVGRAAEVGVRVFNWGSAASRAVPPGWSYARAFAQLEQAAHLIADVMAPLGCTCVIEPINPRECNLVYYVTDAVAVAALVARPQIRVIADYFHVALQNEPLEHIDAAGAWLAHAHTSGPERRFPKPDDPWAHAAFLAALRRVGYDRTLSFESYRLPPGADFATEARAGLAYIRALDAQVRVTRS